MPDESLNYQTPNRNSGDGLRAATWISTLTLGIIYALLGGFLCFGLLSVIQGFPDARDIDLYFMIYILISLGMLITAALYILNSIRIRTRSHRAAEIIQVVAGVNIAVLILFSCISFMMLVPAAGVTGGAIFLVCGIWLIPLLANIAVAKLCTRALEHPHALYQDSPPIA